MLHGALELILGTPVIITSLENFPSSRIARHKVYTFRLLKNKHPCIKHPQDS